MNKNENSPAFAAATQDEKKKRLSYKPAAYWFRKELRDAPTKEDAIETGLVVVEELEQLKAWVRAQGLVPPKFIMMPSERRDRQEEAEVYPFPTTDAESERAE